MKGKLKKAVQKAAALSLSALMLGSVMPSQTLADILSVTASAEAVELLGNETDGYYYNMPQTGENTLDLTDKSAGFSFSLYDDGGASNEYSNGCNSTLTVTAPDGCVLFLNGSMYTENNYSKRQFKIPIHNQS